MVLREIWLALRSIFAFCALLVIPLYGDDPGFTAVLSSSPTPPGGTAQITLTLPTPVALVTGGLSLDLDPAVFDNISIINVFSATGDQVGTADLRGRHAEVQFTSDSGGVGRLPGYPVLEVTVPVLGTAKPGAPGGITAQSKSPWRDILGNTYTMSFQSSGVLIGGGMSILSVVPGGGSVPAGTQVQINGQGFTPSTNLQLDNVAWSSLQFVNSRQFNFTLTGPADLTGRLVLLTDANGAKARYYSALTPTNVRPAASVPASVQPIFSQVNYLNAEVDTSAAFALENPSLSPVDVVFETDSLPIGRTQPPPNTSKITIAPGGVYIADSKDMPPGSFSPRMLPSAPLRKVLLCCWYTDKFTASAPSPSSASAFSALGVSSPITFDWRPGDPPPAAIVLTVYYASSTQFAIHANTEDGTGWLSAAFSDRASQMTVSVDPTDLSLGRHQGIVTVTAPGAIAPSLQLGVILNVNSYPTIANTPPSSFAWSSSGTLSITSGAGAVPITARALDDWLTVSPASATTPADLTVSVTNPWLVAGQAGGKQGIITVQGPGNTLQVPVYIGFDLGGVVYPTQVTISAEYGQMAQVQRRIDVSPVFGSITFDSSTDSGGPWLSASFGGPGNPALWVSANPVGLSPGTYHGTVAMRSAGGSPVDPVSVTFIVWASPPPPPRVAPSNLEFTVPARVWGYQLLSLSTGVLPLEFLVESQTDDGQGWLGADGPPVYFSVPRYTPTDVLVQTFVRFPGVYRGCVMITSPPGAANTVTVPVTLTATPAPPLTGAPPLIASIVNGASFLSGPISPGEIVSVFGIFGANLTSGVSIGHDQKVNNSSYGNRILFNGVPAPILYMSPSQINAVVPYEIAGSSTATVEVDVSDIHSQAWSVPVAPSAPGLFTQAGSGQGDAAVLNQDNSLNTQLNPAPRGSIVQLFGTGAGQTNPPSTTGEVTQMNVRSLVPPITVTIGGADAEVISATTAPKAVTGLFQINAQVPSAAQPGPAPVVVRIGSAPSQAAAIVSVR